MLRIVGEVKDRVLARADNPSNADLSSVRETIRTSLLVHASKHAVCRAELIRRGGSANSSGRRSSGLALSISRVTIPGYKSVMVWLAPLAVVRTNSVCPSFSCFHRLCNSLSSIFVRSCTQLFLGRRGPGPPGEGIQTVPPPLF